MADGNVFGFGFKIFAKDEASKVAQKATKAVSGLGDAIDKTAMKAQNAGRGFNQMGAPMTASGQIAGFLSSKMMALVAVIGAYLSIRYAKHFFKDMMDFGSKAEQHLIMLTGLLGDATKASAAYQFAIQKQNETTFEVDDIIAGMNKLVSFKVDPKKNFDLLANMGVMAGKSFSEASTAVAMATQGMPKMLRGLNVDVKAMQKTLEGLTPATKQYQAAILGYLNGVERFRGGVERMKNTLKGMKSDIGGIFFSLKQAFVGLPGSGGLYDAWKRLVENVLVRFRELQPKLIRIFETVGQLVAHIVDIASRVLGHMFNVLTRWVDSLAASFEDSKKGLYPLMVFLDIIYIRAKQFFEGFAEGWREGSKGIDELSKWIKSLFGESDNVEEHTTNWFALGKAIGTVVSAVKMLAIVFYLLGKAVEGIKWLFELGGKGIDLLARMFTPVVDMQFSNKGAQQNYKSGSERYPVQFAERVGVPEDLDTQRKKLRELSGTAAPAPIVNVNQGAPNGPTTSLKIDKVEVNIGSEEAKGLNFETLADTVSQKLLEKMTLEAERKGQL